MSYYAPTFPTTYGQGYGYQQPMAQQRPAMQPQPTTSGFICRPVASEEEARAFPTDFTGSTLVLVDAAHNRIYTKALNMMDGSAVFTVYQGTEQAQPAPPMEYAPMRMVQDIRRDLDDLISTLTAAPKEVTA